MNFLRNTLVLCSLFYFLSQSLFSQPGWVTQSSGTTEHMRSVFFVNDMTGWAVGYAGKILKTTNGGTNWISQTSPTANPLFSVFFVSTTVGWAVGAMGDIITTGNGGTSWTLQTTGITSALNSVHFISATTGWAAGEFMTILKTTNSGVNWIPLLSSSLAINSVFFNNSLVGYVAGNGFLYKTTNGGLNWSAPISNPAWYLYSVHFPAGITTTGYTVGMGSPSPPILKSTDSGNNWAILPVPLGNALTSVFFANVSTGWAAGWIGTIMYTSDGGTNWSDQISGTSNSLRSIYFTSAATGWAVGDLGTILKTTNGGITAIEPISNNIPENFSLKQNFPNPFNPNTKIRFSIPATPLSYDGLGVGLYVYDILGSEMVTLVNEQLKPGTYEVEWDGANFASGIYCYKLIAGDYSQTKKMILVK
ncbi:MAG: T9SS type A sorting domain-containing protein [Ignavibacteria bacterium]|nr:T9SS type A sorting domain-containing protein [Ignavibacteria bacterium]MCC7159277.1 T9SS type A sorting domain-containing protein [Ignavibacteria bacterium]